MFEWGKEIMKQRTFDYRRILLLLCLPMILVACSSDEPSVRTKLIALDVKPDANLNHPIALDLVIVYNTALMKDLLGISSKEWFEKRSQYKLDYPGDLQNWEWELVPGQAVPFFKLPGHARDGVGGIIFASYVTPGTHRARFDPYEGIVVRLEEREFVVHPLSPDDL